MIKIAVLGNGSWGSVLGSMLADNGNDVTLYGNIDSVNEEINAHHTNSHYMKDWKLNENTKATGDLEAALDGAELVLFVLPTKAVRIVAKNVRKVLDKTGAKPLLVTATKGIEPGSKKLISEILTEEIYPDDEDKIVAISGPSHAENVAQKDLTAIACASTNEENAKRVQELFSNDYVRFYTNDDLVGADMVCFIHRPEYYKITEDERGNSLIGLAEIIIAKHRNGAVGDVRLRFKSEFAKFMNVEEDIAVREFSSTMNGGDPMPPIPSAGADFLSQGSSNEVPF